MLGCSILHTHSDGAGAALAALHLHRFDTIDNRIQLKSATMPDGRKLLVHGLPPSADEEQRP